MMEDRHMQQVYPYRVKQQVTNLIGTLQALVNSDPEQEIQGTAIPALAATFGEIRSAFPDDPVVSSIIDPLMADALGYRIRAVDMLCIARLVDAAISCPPVLVERPSITGQRPQPTGAPACAEDAAGVASLTVTTGSDSCSSVSP